MGETLVKLSKMTPEAMVQALKAKGYIPRDEVAEDPGPAQTDKYAKLREILSAYTAPEIHIHLDD